jgi:two-component system, OmpR family, phosphate regulon response regulator PhoB
MTMPELLPIELPPIDIAPPRILAVDDEADVRDLIDLKLTAAGFRVWTVANGRLGLSVIERSMPDLLILDVAMPDLSGIEVCRLLRKSVRTQQLPIIMLTARAHIQHEYEGLVAGADLYLTKPFSPRDLVARIWDLLSYTRTE